MAWELALVAGLTAFGLVRALAKGVEILGEWVHIAEKTAVLTPCLSSEESDLVAGVMSGLGSSPMRGITSEGATITAVNEELWRSLYRETLAVPPYIFASMLERWSGHHDQEARWRDRLHHAGLVVRSSASSMRNPPEW
ncbi:MAG: hypothetical protein ACP5HZ_10780 [Ferrimicrobium sp.]